MRLPDPASVRTLLLDAGGVLVRPNFARVAEALRARGVRVEAAALAAAEPLAKKELDRPSSPGFSTDAERGWHYFNLVLSRAGIARSAATDAALVELKAWHDQHCLWEDVLEWVRPSLERFRAAGVRPVLVDEAGLYPDADCPRVHSLAGLASHLVPEAGGRISAKLPAER